MIATGFKDEEVFLAELPKPAQVLVAHNLLKTQLQSGDIKTSRELYTVIQMFLVTAPPDSISRTKEILHAAVADLRHVELVSGVIAQCLQEGQTYVLLRILSTPGLVTESESSSILSLADLDTIVSAALDPIGSQFNPASKKTHDIFFRWLESKGRNPFALMYSSLSRYFGYFGDSTRFELVQKRDGQLAMRVATSQGHQAFVERYITMGVSTAARHILFYIALLRQDLPILKTIIFGPEGSDSTPTLPPLELSEENKLVVFFLVSEMPVVETGLFPFIKETFFKDKFPLQMTTEAENAMSSHLASEGEMELRRSNYIWTYRRSTMEWGSDALIKSFLRRDLFARPYTFVILGLIDRRKELLAIKLLREVRAQGLIRFQNLLKIIDHSARLGRLEVLKEAVSLATEAFPKQWRPKKLLRILDRRIPAPVLDWIFEDLQPSPQVLLKMLWKKKDFPRIGVIMGRVGPHPSEIGRLGLRKIVQHDYLAVLQLLNELTRSDFFMDQKWTIAEAQRSDYESVPAVYASLTQPPHLLRPSNVILWRILQKARSDLPKEVFLCLTRAVAYNEHFVQRAEPSLLNWIALKRWMFRLRAVV